MKRYNFLGNHHPNSILVIFIPCDVYLDCLLAVHLLVRSGKWIEKTNVYINSIYTIHCIMVSVYTTKPKKAKILFYFGFSGGRVNDYWNEK